MTPPFYVRYRSISCGLIKIKLDFYVSGDILMSNNKIKILKGGKMNRRGSTPVIVLVVLILISLSFAGGAFYLLQQEKQKSTDLEEKLDEISTKQRITESKLDEAKKSMTDLQLKYEESKMKIDALTQDLEQEKQARIQAEGRIEQMSVDLDQQKELRSDLEDRLSKAQNDVRMTQGQLKDLDARKTELEAKVKDLEVKTQEIELGNIVVVPEAAPAPVPAGKKQPAPVKEAVKAGKKPAATVAPALQGQVLVVNKEYSFAVISLGNKDGAKLNQVFSVYRGKTYLGDVKVEKVHDSMSAAGFLSASLKSKIRENDKVVQKVQ